MKAKSIVYAEDEENDAFFFKRALNQVGIASPLVVLPDGQETIDYFSSYRPSSPEMPQEEPLPCLLLLDLNMPRKSGMEVLEYIRKESAMSTLPVIILTSSQQESDIYRAYSQGANAYLVKPAKPDELLVMVQAIKDFWLTLNQAVSPQTVG